MLHWIDEHGTTVTKVVSPTIEHDEIVALIAAHAQEVNVRTKSTKIYSAPAIRNVERVEDARRINLDLLTHARGTKQRLARFLGFSPGWLSSLINGTADVTDELARKIEQRLGLPKRWLDSAHGEGEVPRDVTRFIETIEPASAAK